MSRDRDRKLEQALKHQLRAAGTPDRDACVDAETLGAWADGGLDAVQMAMVESHVANCGRCQAIVGVAARSAPAPAVSEAPAVWLWKWWLAPIAAGAAAVTLWMVVPQETMPPLAPAQVIEAKKDAPTESPAMASEPARETPPPAAPQADNRLADATRQRRAPALSGRDDSQRKREEFLERKQENRAADQVAVGSVAAAPPAAATAVAEAALQKSLRLSAALEIVSPDSRRRWRVTPGAVERSEDAGTSWTQVHPAAGDSITGGTAPGGSICWLIGANGVVLVTADGSTFARVPIPERVALRSITATDARSATVTTADGRRFSTDDAGRSWRVN